MKEIDALYLENKDPAYDDPNKPLIIINSKGARNRPASSRCNSSETGHDSEAGGASHFQKASPCRWRKSNGG